MTISMYEASVGLFVPYLRNLSVLLDKGVAYAEARKFNPAVLLGMIDRVCRENRMATV